jgi:hypothetical protein
MLFGLILCFGLSLGLDLKLQSGRFKLQSVNGPYSFSDCSWISSISTDNQENGGAISLWYNLSSITITRCSFVLCSSFDGGAIWFISTGIGFITACNFSQCSAVHAGGAMHLSSMGLTIFFKCQWIGCQQTRSSADGGSSGGAISMSPGTTELKNRIIFYFCYFEGNHASGRYLGHDIVISNWDFGWTTTSPFDMNTCWSKNSDERTWPIELAGYNNSEWLPNTVSKVISPDFSGSEPVYSESSWPQLICEAPIVTCPELPEITIPECPEFVCPQPMCEATVCPEPVCEAPILSCPELPEITIPECPQLSCPDPVCEGAYLSCPEVPERNCSQPICEAPILTCPQLPEIIVPECPAPVCEAPIVTCPELLLDMIPPCPQCPDLVQNPPITDDVLLPANDTDFSLVKTQTPSSDDISDIRTQQALKPVVTVLAVLVACAVIGVVCNIIGLYKINKTEKTLSTPILSAQSPALFSPKPRKIIMTPWSEVRELESLLADIRSTAESPTVRPDSTLEAPPPIASPSLEPPIPPPEHPDPSLLVVNPTLVSPPALTPPVEAAKPSIRQPPTPPPSLQEPSHDSICTPANDSQ